MRKTITTLFAVAALAVAALAASSAALPSAAQAATCAEWRLPMDTYRGGTTKRILIPRTDGWWVTLTYRYGGDGYWHGSAWKTDHPNDNVFGAIAYFNSVTADSVAFTTTWPNGIVSHYTGTIRSDGYVSGVMVERHGSTIYRTYWNMNGGAVCVR